MKYIILFLILGLSISEARAQYLRAGFISDSTYINDLEPDSILNAIANSPNSYKFYNVDCNGDGIPDFIIDTYWMKGSHGMWETKSAKITPLNSNKVAYSRIDTSEHAPGVEVLYFPVAQKFLFGDTINTFTKFIDSTVYLAEDSWVMGEYGITIDDWLGSEGYIGLYFNDYSKYYWIKVTVNSTTNVSVMELLNESNSFGLESFINPEQMIDVFPNPCNEYVNINFDISTNEIKVKLYNSMGKLVGEFCNQKANESIEIDVSDLNAGVYFMHFFDLDNNRQFTRKIIVE